MAIKAGQILHAMNQFIVDRIQTGGAGNLNIPQERVFELGNYQSVGVVRDVPDLSFTLDVLDVSTQVEALVCGSTNPAADALGDGTTTAAAAYALALYQTVDIISPFKSLQGAYNVVKGVAVPQLALESVSYKYGYSQNATETFTLRGDSIYYIPGIPFLAQYVGDGATTAFIFETNDATPVALDALLYTEQGASHYALNVSVNGVRQAAGTDYTETNTGITFAVAPVTGAHIRIVFGSNTTAALSPEVVTYSQAVNADLSVKPAAIHGRDIKVYVGLTSSSGSALTLTTATSGVITSGAAHGLVVGDIVRFSVASNPELTTGVDYYVKTAPSGTTFTVAATPAGTAITFAVTGTGTAAKYTAARVYWHDVQSATVDWKVTLEADYEFGNAHAVARDFVNPPDVTGTFELKAITVDFLFAKLNQITGVPGTDVVGPQSSVLLPVWIELLNPASGGTSAVPQGTVLKTLYIPDARFTIPGYEGKVSTKLVSTLAFTSDTGVLTVFKGTPLRSQDGL